MSYLLATDLTHLQQRINHFLAEKLKTTDSVGSPLVEAMAYAVLLGGKRVRPFFNLCHRQNAWCAVGKIRS